MSDDRASRLRSRRGRARQRAEDQQREGVERPDDTTAVTDTPNDSDDASVSNETPARTDAAGTDEEGDGTADEESGSVKDERVGTYMYLPESQKRELERVYGTLKVQYEYEFDEEFEKNRHFFPAVVQHGLEALDGMDAAEVRAVVDDL